jgi:SAM-dependent methyltransferase
MSPRPGPRLYADLASWWPLLSPPDDYAEEAEWVWNALVGLGRQPPRTALELGSGGGNLASHLAKLASMTLSDRSPAMLEVSRRLNPQSEHIEADMRRLRLGRRFDAVIIHDSVMYMTCFDDLVAALATAHAHVEADGALIVLPDYVAETFEPHIDSGGHDATDGSGRALRYLSWAHAPSPGATAQDVDFVIMLRMPDGCVEVVHDRHSCGIFPRDAWHAAFLEAGFAPAGVCRDPWRHDIFIARPR